MSTSDNSLLVGCCCLFLVLIVAIVGYMYKIKGIKSNNISLSMCAFSSTPLVGTWTSVSNIATITYNSSSYNVNLSSPTGTLISSTPGCTLVGSTLTIPSVGSAVINGLVLTLTTPTGVVVFNKTSC